MMKGFWGTKPMNKVKGEESKETIVQKKIDETVEELAKMEIKQRQQEKDEEGEEQLSEHWLKFKISQVEHEWSVEKFDEVQPSHSMKANVSLQRETEKCEADKAERETKQNTHVEISREREKTKTIPELVWIPKTEGSHDPEIEKGGDKDELSPNTNPEA